jgi:ribonuclease Z
MTFKVTILGTGSARPTLLRHHSAHALNVHEQFYLIDCGEGTQLRLMECGINPLKLNAIFISHLHGDHLFGLMPLISSLGHLGRKVPLTVFAPAPFGEILACHFRFFDNDLPFEVIWREVDTRQNAMIYENNVMEVWTIPLRHRVPASGYLFKEKTPPLNIRKEAIERYGLGIAQITAAKRGEDLFADNGSLIATNSELTYTPYPPRSYAYCSDTQYSGKVASIVAGVDLLYHEATFADADKALAKETGHSTASQAAKAALTACAGRLLIGHLSARYKDASTLLNEARLIFPNTEIAEEKRTYEIQP